MPEEVLQLLPRCGTLTIPACSSSPCRSHAGSRSGHVATDLRGRKSNVRVGHQQSFAESGSRDPLLVARGTVKLNSSRSG